MGVLTDFVAVPRNQADAVCASPCPSRDFNGTDAKGVDTIKLATLNALLTDSEYSPSFMNDTVCSGGDEGPWVFEVPSVLVDRLATLRDEDLGSVAGQWATTDEFQLDEWPLEDVETMLGEVAALCRKAKAAGHAVLMWMSL
jgi:hypothetical protein